MSILDSAYVHTVEADHSAPAAPRPVAPATTQAGSQEALEFLAWVARQPRTYAEAMAVWQTSCPRHSIWEDAIADGLIQVENGGGRPAEQTAVMLTPRGRAVLAGT